MRYIDIHKLANAIGKELCQALIGVHAFTGCDTVSAFYGKGKAKAVKLVKADIIYQNVFSQLGREWMVSEDTFDLLQAFTCMLYDQIKSGVKVVNELRYNIFIAKTGEADSSQLPPCRDCLAKHVARANYQAGIWRRCLENDPDIPYPIDHGWVIDEPSTLSVEWMSGPTAPDDILEMLSCKCSRQCRLPDCVCLKNGLRCTYMCKLQTCLNQATTDDVPEYFDGEEELDSEMDNEVEEEME